MKFNIRMLLFLTALAAVFARPAWAIVTGVCSSGILGCFWNGVLVALYPVLYLFQLEHLSGDAVGFINKLDNRGPGTFAVPFGLIAGGICDAIAAAVIFCVFQSMLNWCKAK